MDCSNLIITAIFLTSKLKALIKPSIPYIIHAFTSEIEELYTTNELTFTIVITFHTSLPMLLENLPCQNNLTADINN
jgi:hypothetical protein